MVCTCMRKRNYVLFQHGEEELCSVLAWERGIMFCSSMGTRNYVLFQHGEEEEDDVIPVLFQHGEEEEDDVTHVLFQHGEEEEDVQAEHGGWRSRCYHLRVLKVCLSLFPF